MRTLADQVRDLAHVYVRHGGKKNRRQQVDRVAAMANWIQARYRLNGLGQIGKRQVIAYWKDNRDWAPRTAYAHWLAVRELWRWLGRAGDPPAPWQAEEGEEELDDGQRV